MAHRLTRTSSGSIYLFVNHTRKHVGRFIFTILAFLCLSCSSYAATFGLDAGYPGIEPGRSRIQCTDSVITAGNMVLTAIWTLKQAGLNGVEFRDLTVGDKISFSSEYPQILLTNGQIYRLDQLLPESKPRIQSLEPDPKSARLASRIAGQKVELPL